MSPNAIEAGKILVTVTVLAYSSWRDHQRREIEDWVWVVFAVASIWLNIAMVREISAGWQGALLASLLHIVIFAGLYHVGAFGGADAKSLVCLSLMYPINPGGIPMLREAGPLMTLPIATLGNALLLSLTYVPFNLARNLILTARGEPPFGANEEAPLLKRIASLAVLRRMKASEFLKSTHAFQFAGLDLVGISLSSFFSRGDLSDRQKDSLARSDAYVYVHPLIPLQVFVLAGFIAALLLGDLLLSVPYVLFQVPVGASSA